ncbi:MAG: polysaccharide deacetylase family protein [Oscillospiraceae bacterium]|nr:polysaccharide deacetylase family protein [Oscillospiraceae bacterium]
MAKTKRTAGIALAALAAACLALGLFACDMRTGQPGTSAPTTSTTDPAAQWPGGLEPTTEQLPTGSESASGTSDSLTGDNGLQPTQPVAVNPAGFPSREILRGSPDPAAGTYTGLRPLPARPLAIADPNNSKHLPTTKVEHAFGVAQDETPHRISIDFQKFFETKHYAAVAYDNITKAKVLYLTFDCGYENGNTATILDVLKEKKVPAAFFCTVDEMKGAPEIVARMIKEGHIVGNHSVKHPSFAEISRTRMAQEVIGADNYLRENFGYSAPFFRFPMGEYNESALDAVASLGFTSVFWSAAYADWDPAAQKGAQYALDTVLSRIHPGAILLLHSVSKDNADAMADIIDGARSMGYTFRNLTELPQLSS